MERFVARARQLRAARTGAEHRLWQALRNRKLARWKFRRQWPIAGFVTDFACIDGRLVVEVDGATHSTDAERARDAERTRLLQVAGYEVLRISNAEVYDTLMAFWKPFSPPSSIGRPGEMVRPPLPAGER